MTWLYLANVGVVLVACWALWERRLTLGSRWDASITYGIAFFGLGAVLDSPWRAMASASHPLTGRYYLAMALGHVCYLAGAAMGIRATYERLLSDHALRSFMRTWIAPLVSIAAAIMVTSIVLSPMTSTMTVDHLYLAHPDGWLAFYWITFLGTLSVLELISAIGASRLRADPRSVMVDKLLFFQGLGTLAILFIAFGVLTARTEIPRVLVWPFAYVGIAGGCVAAVISWRHRVSSFREPLGPGEALTPG